MLPNSPLYAGLLALLFLWLSLQVVAGRRLHKVSVGDGNDKDMRKRMRVQANWAEYAPIAIILLVMAELQGFPPWLIHIHGTPLVIGRVLHAWGLGSTPQIVWARQAGMYLTVAAIASLALLNIWCALFWV